MPTKTRAPRFGGALLLSLAGALLLAAAGPAAAQDIVWPKVLTGERGEVQIYQPQIESFTGNRLEARAAVSVTEKGESGPIFGAVWFGCDLATDQEAGTATLERVDVLAAKFPDTAADKVDALSRYLEAEIPRWELVISLDQLTASLDGVTDVNGADDNLRSDPPAIHVRHHPAVLVLIDGDPVITGLEGFELDYVANSMFFIARDRDGGAYWLRGAGRWFTATDLGGPWAVSADLPSEVAEVSERIDADEKEQDDAEQDDAESLGVEADKDERDPEIIVSTAPAELVVTDGAPDFAPVSGTQLLHLRNTESDVVMDIAGQQYYVLVSGRWYRSKSLTDGPWSHVDFADLPADFADIPEDSDLGAVLASVPGTQQSREAVLETQIPQTAEVDRKTATCTVTYDGDPKFENCGDGVAYALNTDKSVLRIDGRFYCVDSAVWFASDGPEGPWAVATEVPAKVQDLPADCPVYNVKYVYIYDSTPEVVYVGYTPGYYGYYVYGPCVVYGTGWYYRPWWGHYYYPRPVTYGFGVHYNPWTGWGFTFGMSYGWLHVGVGWGRPYYGCWGPSGYRYGYRHGYWHGYNHGYRHGYNRGVAAGYRAGYKAAQRQPKANLYRDRATGVRRTGDLGKQTRQRPVVSDRRNNVYTDRDGNVYRDRDGAWEKREGGDWKRDGDIGRDDDRTRPDDRQRDRDRDRDQVKPSDRQRDQVKPQERPQDRSREQVKPQDRGGKQRDRQQLDRDRSQRQRGMDRQRQAPPRQPQRQAPQRGGGRGGRR
jgi:hypothetical protein